MKKHQKITLGIFSTGTLAFLLLWLMGAMSKDSTGYIFYKGTFSVIIVGTIGFYHKDKLKVVKDGVKVQRLRKKALEKLDMLQDAIRDQDIQRIVPFTRKVLKYLAEMKELDSSDTNFDDLIEYSRFLQSLNEYNLASKVRTPEYQELLSIIHKTLKNG